MSRLKHFTRSLVSGYLLIGVNVLYTLASVRLALHYLSNREFGLWATILQIANFIALVDLGMGSSIARILIDHKDDRPNGRYGGAIKSGFLVGAVQGAITLVVGLSLVWFLAGWLKLDADLARPFFWLMIGQVLLTAAAFSTRTFTQVLYAWQRMDFGSYTVMIQLFASFAAMWFGFHIGFGIFSLLAGAATAWLCGVVINAWACCHLGFWPKAGEWGRASRQQFRELFHYGADVFLISVGTQLIMSSQTVLIVRQLGPEPAALWSVMTKMFTLITQVVSKIIGNAMPAFAEMQVRREWGRLWHRYRGVFITSNVMAAACGVLFVACNSSFVTIWTQGKFSWSQMDNLLLGFGLVIMIQQVCFVSIIVCLKEIKGLKYVYLVEGLVFVAVSLAVLPATGITGMLVCSVAGTLLFTWLNGAWRIAKLTRMGWRPLLWEWQKPMLRVLLVMIPCGLAIHRALHGTTNWLQLILTGGFLAIVGAWTALRYAMPPDLTSEIVVKLPRPFQRACLFLMRKAHSSPGAIDRAS